MVKDKESLYRNRHNASYTSLILNALGPQDTLSVNKSQCQSIGTHNPDRAKGFA